MTELSAWTNVVARRTAAAEAFPHPALPVRAGRKVHGVFEAPDMSGRILIGSGGKGPTEHLDWENLDTAAYGVGSHVEVHAAALQRALGLREATLHINHPKVCIGCMSNV